MMSPINYEKNVAYIIGCQRSGNTLLRLILDAHPEVATIEELTSFELLSNQNLFDSHIRIRLKSGKKLCVFKIPHIGEQLANQDNLIRKEQKDPSFPFEFQYKGEKLIFMIRDPRAVYQSLLNYYKKHDPDLEHIPPWEFYVDNFAKNFIVNFDDKYSKELRIIKKLEGNSSAAKAALFWNIKNESFFKYLDLGYNIIPINYEMLVKQPQDIVPKICDFLELDFDTQMLHHETIQHSFTDEKGITLGDTKSNRMIDLNSMSKYKTVLDKESEEIILSMTNSLWKKMQF